MGLGQVGVDGVSAVRHVEKAGGGEIVIVHPLCMGGGLAVENHLRLVAAEIMSAVLTAL